MHSSSSSSRQQRLLRGLLFSPLQILKETTITHFQFKHNVNAATSSQHLLLIKSCQNSPGNKVTTKHSIKFWIQFSWMWRWLRWPDSKQNPVLSSCGGGGCLKGLHYSSTEQTWWKLMIFHPHKAVEPTEKPISSSHYEIWKKKKKTITVHKSS